jgi:hypothetical protein
MDTSVLIWFVIFIIAMLFFFGTAVVITVVGAKDLRDLLSGSTTKE